MRIFIACLTILMSASFAMAQGTVIKGKIIDQSTNEPVAGATVSTGPDNSTLTNANGEFELTVEDTYQNITVSAEGFGTQTIFLGGKTKVDVSLSSNSFSNDPLNVGFGKSDKKSITGSVSSIKGDEGTSQPVLNLEQANQGKSTGLFVQSNGGNLGEAATVRVRGGSSLSNSNQPLYVVDGVPLASNAQSNIDPNNIESIEILKDASASAIYGSRAANGVIIITTKSGNSGKLKINAGYQFGISQTPKKLDLYDAREQRIQTIEGILRGIFNIDDEITRNKLEEWVDSEQTVITGLNPPVIAVDLSNFGYERLTQYETDWQDEIFRTGKTQQANLSLQGGGKKFGYFGSGSYTNQEGILIGNKFERFNSSLSLNAQPSSIVTLTGNLNYIYTKNNKLNENLDLGYPIQAILIPPTDELDPEDDFRLKLEPDLYNPFTEIAFSSNIEFTNSLITSLGASINLTNKISFDINGGYEYSSIIGERIEGPETDEGSGTGYSVLTENKVSNSVLNSFFTYSSEISDNQNLSLILGGSYQQESYTSSQIAARLVGINLLKELREGDPLYQDFYIPDGSNALISSFGRLDYNIASKYLFQVSARLDGSSKFGKNNRYGIFPAGSLGWVISEENFLNNLTFLSFLKLKSSYGIIGNVPVDDFLYRSNYFNSNYIDYTGLRILNYENPDLKWETTAQFAAGIEFEFLERLSGSVEYYNKKTTDLLFPVPVTQTSGFGSVYRNYGTLTNTGIEITVTSQNIIKPNFQWSTDINISSNDNVVTDLGGLELIVGSNAFIEGQPAGVFYLPKYEGVSTTTGRALYTNANGIPTQEYDEAVNQVVGNPNPKYFGGVSNNLQYKNLTLNFLFQFVYDVDIYFATGELLANSGIGNYPQLMSQATDRWYNTGDALYPVHNSNANENASSRHIYPGDYLRLKNITLSYNLPVELINKMGLTEMNVYIGGQNLLTFTDYIGYDPDVNYIDPQGGVIGQNITRGVDLFNAPQPRTFIIGLNISL
ncbi:SusC/RagA family TonB-linked outer membrane protein [Marinoscillum pacificum]|uniref:SusC/RagA family TonB-linked outer membrane protein n=1 Tax=Marinoscillum pacificum TaxID=392723 RepID=UPI0021583C7E|nr:SusC/RagA family TonB-linked outer membrane protein [Marinoscillum pacificum]